MLINGIIWLIAAMIGCYNAVTMEQNAIWILITIVFAANGIRRIVQYIKVKKQSGEE